MENKVEIGVQLYTLRKLCKTPDGVAKVIENCARLGASTVQLSSICEMPAKQLRSVADGCGVSICATHSPFERITGDLDRLAEEHLTLGAEIIGLGMMPREYFKTPDSLSRFIDIANTTAERLKPYGLKFGYHNHFFEFRKFSGETKYDIMLHECPEVQFILDTYWVRFSGYDPADYIAKLSGRLDLLHLKDYRKALIGGKICDVGAGILDFGKILSAAQDAGTKWAVIEHDFTREPYRTVENGIRHFHSVYG